VAGDVKTTESLRQVHRQTTPLAYVKVEGEPVGVSTELPTADDIWEKTRCVIPPDLSSCPVSRSRTFELKIQNGHFLINQREFNSSVITDSFFKDSCEEWTLRTGDGRSHPFHVHVNPFQVVARDGQRIPPFWADTLLIDSPHTYTVRTTFRHFDGDTVIHCHILDHEDQGMMTRVEIYDPCTPGLPRPAVAESAALQAQSQLPLPGPVVSESRRIESGWPSAEGPFPRPRPAVTESRDLPAQGSLPALRPPVTESRKEQSPLLDVTTLDARRIAIGPRSPVTVLVFFEGASCPRCVQQLKSFIAARRGWGDGKVPLLAISSQAIADYGKLAKNLGIATDDPVFISQDPQLVHFRKMGCEDDGPLHGTFVIKDGTVVWKKVGFMPFLDAKTVERAVAGNM
jgi:peroxiredoxin